MVANPSLKILIPSCNRENQENSTMMVSVSKHSQRSKRKNTLVAPSLVSPNSRVVLKIRGKMGILYIFGELKIDYGRTTRLVHNGIGR